MNYLAFIGVTAATAVVSCTPAKKEYASYELYPVRSGSLTEMEYSPEATKFILWAPTADEVRLMLFDSGMLTKQFLWSRGRKALGQQRSVKI